MIITMEITRNIITNPKKVRDGIPVARFSCIMKAGGEFMSLRPSIEMERVWAKEKYDVLAKSQKIYLAIRELLKDKDSDQREAFYQLLEEAKQAPDSVQNRINAYYHVYGHLKRVVTLDEKVQFAEMLDQVVTGSVTDQTMRQFLHVLAKRANDSYLLKSTFFQKKD